MAAPHPFANVILAAPFKVAGQLPPRVLTGSSPSSWCIEGTVTGAPAWGFAVRGFGGPAGPAPTRRISAVPCGEDPGDIGAARDFVVQPLHRIDERASAETSRVPWALPDRAVRSVSVVPRGAESAGVPLANGRDQQFGVGSASQAFTIYFEGRIPTT